MTATLNASTRESWPVHELRDEVLETVARATDAQYREGSRWYANAGQLAHTLSVVYTVDGHQLGAETCAAILAALSTRTRWADNVVMAHSMLTDYTLRRPVRRPAGCLGANFRRALAILNGADWRDVIRGPKSRAFTVAIASHGREGGAVVDAWAVKAATAGQYGAVASCRYDDVAQAYADAARELGLTVHATQAIAWTVVRGSAS